MLKSNADSGTTVQATAQNQRFQKQSNPMPKMVESNGKWYVIAEPNANSTENRQNQMPAMIDSHEKRRIESKKKRHI